MQESMTMAEVGSIVNVSGSRIATPFGPPSPGSTPTKMPSTRPTSISARIFHFSRTTKPWNRRVSASIDGRSQGLRSISEELFERALRHDHVERDVESREHDGYEDERGKQRLPERDAADDPHEAR